MRKGSFLHRRHVHVDEEIFDEDVGNGQMNSVEGFPIPFIYGD